MSTLDTRTSTSPRSKLAAAALVTGPIFLGEVAVNSWLSHDFLTAHGWQLRGGDDVPWPSMLALGPHGWAQVLGFAIAGIGVLFTVPALARTLSRRRRRVMAIALVSLLGLAVTLSAAPVDPSMVLGHDPTTWHGWVHGLMFLVLLPTAVLAPLAVAWATRGDARWRPVGIVSAFVSVGVVAALMSGLGNLGFYIFLCMIFGWVATVAAQSVRLDR